MSLLRRLLRPVMLLWSLTLTITLIDVEVTTANLIGTSTTKSSTFESASIENDLKVLRLTTTPASTIQLKINKLDDDNYESREKFFKTYKQIPAKEEATYSSTMPSQNTLTYSNAPAIVTNQANAVVAREKAALYQEQQEKSTEGVMTTTKQNKNNDELEREMEQTDLKQVTERVMEQQQQQENEQPEQITTDVSWRKETAMNQQSKGNDINAKYDYKTIVTIIKPAQSSSAPTTITTIPHDTIASTTSTYTRESKPYDIITTFPTEQNKPDQVKLKEIQGDDVKTINGEMETQTLILEKGQQVKENFKPIIEDANQQLLKERTIFSSKADIANEEWKQNLMPNELGYGENNNNNPLVSKMYEHNINWTPFLHPATPVSDFTGKLLQEQDGVITEIEQKFRLDEFANVNEVKTTQNPKHKASLEFTQTTTFSKPTNPAVSYTVNHKILDINKSPILNGAPADFIERRVKKSFDFPMHRMASDAQHLQQHFDFANTKFNSNSNEQHKIADATINNGSQQTENVQQPSRPQPEFSTTKFYNSKELYNEMMQHKMKLQHQMPHNMHEHDKDIEELKNKAPSLTLNSFAVLHSPKVAKLEEIHEIKEPKQQQQQKSLAIKKVTVKATKHKYETLNSKESPDVITTSASFSDGATMPQTTAASPKDLSSNTEMPLAALIKTKKFQKELKRAKLLIKSMMPFSNTTTTITTPSINESADNNNKLKALPQEIVTTLLPLQTHTQLETAASMQTTSSSAATTTLENGPSSMKPSQQPLTSSVSLSSTSFLHALSATSTNPPKSPLHPIARPRILSRLQEKINSLECELQNLPQDSHLWRGNETHELLLPIMTPENCKSDKDCTAMMVSWEGEAEIQSGDILIVEINDALLTPKEINLTTSAHNTQVYQVTRSGHEHCDVTEGILLDITPLIVDGRKLVTLYDKDLTEGVNLLIVVSELWGAQCVRLKVTTKTENCGESADCSGKGICFSNYDMEEYECQCCSGFAGPHCEEIDACTPSPCTNNGICVDLSQGHEGNSYQCLCPYGYTGKNCQYELDPCNPAECMNGGSCVGNSTHFRCDCTPGYTGPLCQHSLNECESSPCIHGICVDQEDGFRCFCQPGFAGELCNFEYNECESNPCQNGGECIDHIGSYECHCNKGYTGNRCHIKVDFCANKPCPEGRRCIDHGNEYSCECLGGRNGPDCNEMQRTQCNVNPCTHGGTCWSSGESFYCACRPGYTGTMCEDEFVVETVVSSSEFMVDDTSARNFNDKSFGSSVVLKSPIELHNAYTAAIVLALVIFFVALYLTICHCKVNQTYRKFSTRTYGFLPILGFRLRTKQATSKISRHWLSGKGLGIGNVMRTGVGGSASASSSSTSALHATMAAASSKRNNVGHLPTAKASSGKQQHTHVGQLNERPFQRHLAMNLENDMYYTVDFSENSQHSPLIQ